MIYIIAHRRQMLFLECVKNPQRYLTMHAQTLQEKTLRFLDTIKDLMALIAKENFNNILCNIILLVNLLRVIPLPHLCRKVGSRQTARNKGP